MNTTSYIFTSDRLGFRKWTDADIAPFAVLNADPIVMEYFPKTRSYEETVSLVESFKQHFSKHGYGFFAVDRIDTGRFIGFIGLSNPSFAAWFMPCVEIGWRILKEEWGHGFATEGALRCLQFAFEKLQLKEVFSFTAVSNKRSEKVMEKAGMKKVGEFAHPGLPDWHSLQQHVLYRTGADEFIKPS